MNKIILIALVLGATTAQAQLVTSNSAALGGLKSARQQMEAQTESTILEKLEESRLRDEANRRQQFETLNFSVVNDGSAPVQNSTAPTQL
ncbi:hypothetical protein [Bdellovibrio reynosensis]|uniref:Uncharacterized protein n=1 Tax=Bdellovibrio reynosensis TaxID=2835041 RepID=A0ABY4CAB7_9BACT|nr:hypothetical protein [Bdellovibrio reynosensis]UOF01913.1 hypothetical protein MNR06_02960 [Bdellovibrio reynosensis]